MNIVEEPTYRDRELVFKDRVHAGELLAEKLRHLVKENLQILAIPAGGVPVAYTVAKILGAPFDVMVVRKIQIPWNTEAGFGAVTWDGTVILNEPLVTQLGLSNEVVQQCVARTRQMVEERLKKFRGERPLPDLRGRHVVLIDDGLASGFTMLAAVKSVKGQSPNEVTVAVPTASLGAVELLAPNVDRLVCLNIRGGSIFAVADAYRNWYDLTDEEVMKYLRQQS
jgi:predicted phosphoribosyltransferase